jgi:large subunit ribosomal protein L13
LKDNTIQSTIVVDAKLMLVGRLSSNVAKLLINKNKVIVVNADEALFSGNKKSIVNKFMKKLEIGSITHPRHNPKHYKTSHGILKRVIRGMIPRDKPSGITAIKNLRVYSDKPDNVDVSNKTVFKNVQITKPLPFYTSLHDISYILNGGN